MEQRKEYKMIQRGEIIEELTKRGFEVQAYTWINNGAKRKGIRFVSGDIVIVDGIMKDSSSLSAAVEAVISYIRDAGEDADSEFIRHITSSLYIGLQKKNDGGNVTAETEFEGIEKFIYVRTEENKQRRISHSFLELLKISEREAWKAAEKNTFAESETMSLLGTLFGMTGLAMEETEEFCADVVTNTTKVWGASAILNKKVLKKLAQKYKTNRLIVFPSSVHEMIVMPDKGYAGKAELDALVRGINIEVVRPEERLTDRAYIIEIQ